MFSKALDRSTSRDRARLRLAGPRSLRSRERRCAPRACGACGVGDGRGGLALLSPPGYRLCHRASSPVERWFSPARPLAAAAARRVARDRPFRSLCSRDLRVARVTRFVDRVSLVAETTARFPVEIGRTNGGRYVKPRRRRRDSHHRTGGRGYSETRRLLPSVLHIVREYACIPKRLDLVFAVPLGEKSSEARIC